MCIRDRVGGGYGGATAAKYVRTFSGGRVDVTLVEPNATFVSCPLSNLVVSGDRDLASVTVPYDALVGRHGVRWVRDRASAIDVGARQVRLAGGGTLDYDRLILSPGIDFIAGAIPVSYTHLTLPTSSERCRSRWSPYH